MFHFTVRRRLLYCTVWTVIGVRLQYSIVCDGRGGFGFWCGHLFVARVARQTVFFRDQTRRGFDKTTFFVLLVLLGGSN